MSSWNAKPLVDVCERITDGSHRTPPFTEEGYPFATVAHVDADGKIDLASCKRISSTDFEELKQNDCRPLPGDVLFSKDGTVGKVAVIDFDADFIVLSSLAILRPKQEVLSQRFLAYALRSEPVLGEAINRKSGSAIRRIVLRDLRQVSIPIPPLPEQERIVKLLDEADELRKLRAQADRRTADLIPALFYEMFGDVDSNSKKWPAVRFAEIGESRLGKMLDSKQQTGQYKRLYLRNANVQWNRLDLGDMLEMDFSESDRKEFRLRSGDLLICEGGEVGRAAIWRDELPECYFQKALHRVRLHPSKALPEFVLHLLQAIATTNGFRDYVGSATIPHLTGVKLASIRIPLPPLPLQKEFAARVSEIRAMQTEQADSHRRLEDLFQSMLHGAFQGDL